MGNDGVVPGEASQDGVASPLLRCRTASVCGTFFAMAPEVRRQGEMEPEARDGYTFAADWWSLGILTYEMIVAKPPFGYRDVSPQHGKCIRELANESPASINFTSCFD